MSTPTKNPASQFTERERYHMVRRGWLPKTDIPALEALRVEHEALLDQRDAKAREVISLNDRFEQEDEQRRAALQNAYRRGDDPENLPEVTSAEERERVKAELSEHMTATTRAVLEFCSEAVDLLRGDEPHPIYTAAEAVNMQEVPPAGLAAQVIGQIDAQGREAVQRANEAKRAYQEAEGRVRALRPLRMWLIKAGNAGRAGGVAFEPAGEMVAAPTHTEGSAPAAMAAEVWGDDWKQARGQGGEPQHVGADPANDAKIPSGTDEDYVEPLDQSDDFSDLESTGDLTGLSHASAPDRKD